jgi:hypothetical protein
VYELCSHYNVSLLPVRGGVLDILVSDVLDVETRHQYKFAYVNRQRGRRDDEKVNSLVSVTGEICVVVSTAYTPTRGTHSHISSGSH